MKRNFLNVEKFIEKQMLFDALFFFCLLFFVAGCRETSSNSTLSIESTKSENAEKSDSFASIAPTPIDSRASSTFDGALAIERGDVDESRCAFCHRTEVDAWRASFHAKASEFFDSSKARICGDFNDSSLSRIKFDDFSRFSDAEARVILNQLDADSLLYALADAAPETLAIVERLSTDAEKADRTARRDFLRRLGAIRPWRVVDAQDKIVRQIAELLDAGTVALPTSDASDVLSKTRFTNQAEQFFIETVGANGTPQKFRVAASIGDYPLQQYLVESAETGRLQTLPFAWNAIEKRWFDLYPKERIEPGDPLHWTANAQNWNYMCADCHTTGYRKNFDPTSNVYRSGWRDPVVSCDACHSDCATHLAEAERLRTAFPDDSSDALKRRFRRLAARSEGSAPINSATGDHHDAEIWRFVATPPKLGGLGSSDSVGLCGRCHARRRPLTDSTPSPGTPVLDAFVPEKIDGSLYFEDGQILEEDFEYSSFAQAKMFSRGVRCVDCHESHSTALRREGNDVCAQCHRADFYNVAAHLRHAPGTPGSFCKDCHLPASYYMTVDKRYDHNIAIPRPELTLELGTPNACNDCHRDPDKNEDADWARRQIESWRDPNAVLQGGKLAPGEHYAYSIAAGRRLLEVPNPAPNFDVPFSTAADSSAKLASESIQNDEKTDVIRRLAATAFESDDRKVRGLARASAVALLGRIEETEARAKVVDALADSDGLVRLAAITSFDFFPLENPDDFAPLWSALDDPLLAARTEAARVLAEAPDSSFSPERREKLERVLTEYETVQRATPDDPATYLNLGVLEENRAAWDWERFVRSRLEATPFGAPPEISQQEFLRRTRAATGDALALYLTGEKIDPTFVPLKLNLALLLARRGETARAESKYREALTLEPKNGEIWYSLGLLLSESNRPSEALDALRQAVDASPTRARIRYNFALALAESGKIADAIAELRRVRELDAADLDAAFALAFYLDRTGAKGEARTIAQEILKKDPTRRDARQFFASPQVE